VDGVRHEWQEDDVICMPVRLEGNVIQHVNGRRDRSARLISCQPYVEGLGVDLGAGFEQLEDASVSVAARGPRKGAAQ